MSKIKIIYFIHGPFTRGGAFLSLKEIIKRISKNENYDVLVFIPSNHNDELYYTLSQFNIKIKVFSNRFFFQLGKFLIGWLKLKSFYFFSYLIYDTLLSLREVRNINKLIIDFNPDIIHFNSSTFLPFAYLLPSSINFKKIIHVRESIVSNDFRKKIIKILCKKMDSFICISNSEYNQYLSLNLFRKNIFQINNPINSLPTIKKDRKNQFTISCFSGHDKKKGGLLFIKSLKKLKFKKNIKIYFCGPESNQSKYSQKIKRELKLIKNINLIELGLINNVLDIINRSNLLVVPHTRPHFSRTIIEGLSLKVPVLTFPDEWTRSLYEISNKSFYLTNELSSESLSEEIIRIKNSNNLINNKINEGHKFWKKFYEPNKIFKKVKKIYDKLIER